MSPYVEFLGEENGRRGYMVIDTDDPIPLLLSFSRIELYPLLAGRSEWLVNMQRLGNVEADAGFEPWDE